jgi:hypothetical protein
MAIESEFGSPDIKQRHRCPREIENRRCAGVHAADGEPWSFAQASPSPIHHDFAGIAALVMASKPDM